MAHVKVETVVEINGYTLRGSNSVTIIFASLVIVGVSVNSLTTKKQTTNFFVCEFLNVKSKLYPIENSKTIGQTV